MTNQQTQRAIRNYKRDIERFRKARKLCPVKSAEHAKYTQGIENLKGAIAGLERSLNTSRFTANDLAWLTGTGHYAQ